MPPVVGKVVQQLRQFVENEPTAGLRDAHLLERFKTHHDESAIAELIQRHGPLVYGVCRRVLQNDHDAEDALQAVFLVLARRAAAIRKPASLASWLYGVALRLAMKMKTDASKRRRRESSAPAAPPTTPDDLSWREFQGALDEELGRLPESQRQPLLLCYLQGLSQEEAAAQLGWPRGTLKRRLERGREALRKRLTRRGLTLTAGLLAVLPAQDSLAAALPPTIRTSLPQAAALFAARSKPVAGLVTEHVIALAEGTLRSMTAARVKSMAIVLMLLAVILGPADLVAQLLFAHGSSGEPATTPPPPWVNQQPVAKPAEQAGDPQPQGLPEQLPPRAMARLGTLRFRHAGLASFVYSADAHTLHTAGSDQTIRSFDVKTGAQTHQFSYKEKFATFAPDGKRVIFFTREGAVRICEIATGKELASFKAHPLPDQVWYHSPVLLLPDQKTAVTAELPSGFTGIGNGLQYFFDMTSGKEIRRIGDGSGTPGGNSLMPGGVVSPDGSLLATADIQQPKMALWSTRTGQVVHSIKLPDYATNLDFSADGKMLAVGHVNAPEITLVETATGQIRSRLKLPDSAKQRSIYWVSFSPAGNRLAGLSEDGRIWIWNLLTQEIEHTFAGQSLGRYPPSQGPIFSPDGETLTSAAGSSVAFWNLKTGQPIALRQLGHSQAVVDAFLAPDGKTAITSDGKTVRFWDAATGKETRLLDESTLQMGLSRDGKHLVTLGSKVYTGRINGVDGNYVRGAVFEGPLKIWDLPRAGEPREIDLGKTCREVVFSPDLSTLAVADWFNKVAMYEVATGKKIQEWPEDTRGSLFFAPDGKWLVSLRTFLGIWLLKPGSAAPMPFPGDTSGSTVAISPDGKSLGIWGKDNVFLVYDVQTGKVQSEIKGLMFNKVNVAFLQGGKTLICHQNKSLTIRDIASGEEKGLLKELAGPWLILPSGKTVAAVLEDGKTIGLFDLPSGKRLQVLAGHQALIRCLSIDADGRRLISGSEDCTALLWDLRDPAQSR
jgi:RNA polymerase sigma factor (sigma-70 family)